MLENVFSNHFSHRIILSLSTNCRLNLAKEISLLYHPDCSGDILYLWQNSPVVVIGKHQNPYKECNMQFMKENNIMLARRPTGGGAVYQDLGNTCWTFISPHFNPLKNNELLIKSLSHFNIQAKATGRNDLEINGYKISGAAFRKIPERSIHHGTLLIDVNMKNLSQALNVDTSKLQAKGINSVRSRVINLRQINKQINHDSFCESLIKAFLSEKKLPFSQKIEKLTEQDLKNDDDVFARYTQFCSKEWLFENVVNTKISASNRFDFGLFDISFQISKPENSNHGIKNAIVYSDCLDNDLVVLFQNYLNHKINEKSFIEMALNKKAAIDLIHWTKSEAKKWNLQL